MSDYVCVCVLVNPIQTVRTNGGLTIDDPVSSDLGIPQNSSKLGRKVGTKRKIKAGRFS